MDTYTDEWGTYMVTYTDAMHPFLKKRQKHIVKD